MATALSYRQVTKRFGAVTAVDGVSLELKPGERVALIGASGSGKSTLIRLGAGLEVGDRSSGEIRVFDGPVQSAGRLSADARKARRRIGLIFQQFNLVNRSSVMTNVLIGALGRMPGWRGTLGLFSAEERRAAMAALAEVGIPEQAAKRAARLSGGQQQRVAIARALMQGAEIILADEPIASLDPKSARRVMDLLVALSRDHGITLMVSLHQVDYATAFFDRVVAMRAGRIVFDGPAQRLTPAFLTELYGAQAEELILPGQVPPAARPEARARATAA